MDYFESLSGNPWPVRMALVVVALVFAVLVYDAAMALCRRSLRLRSVIDEIRRPGRIIVVGIVLQASLVSMDLPSAAGDILRRGLMIGIIGVAGFAVARIVGLAFDRAIMPYAAREDAMSRARRTQLDFFRRASLTGVAGLTIAFCLTTMPAVRAMGISLFASAGVAGIVIGLAAQPTISNLIAGIQIAMTQPIRIGDVVVVEGEWGRIEEISSTYVVVAIWDQRRLILPLSYFLQKPFQNWTRQSTQILQPVFLHVDYSLPVSALREQLNRVLERTPLWDQRVANLQVTDLGEHAMQLRALVSAADSGKAWDLRCLVREELVTWIREHHPQALPRARMEAVLNLPGERRAA
ncbi:mechanosensitive ion channel family protein [Vineibacter terrae]|uniref:mechanosensitive ion channel family protein n=1 Tax=Vineibacter terrae TaxID=2586908 RepID=UPI002E361FFE|nr:mechanosensitive ion channel domain-containing protein [Vineibacter terrae]HEX2885962.1 mechanosensitive ion channel domain-containing protein [Vineibacter terrae]